MQALRAAPREALTDAQVRDQLGRPLRTRVGLELLRPDLSLVREITKVGAGKVTHRNLATIHGTLDVNLDEALDWGAAIVRPYVEARARVPGGATTVARYYQGAFCTTAPTTVVAGVRSPYQVGGFDRLYLLDRFLGDTYAVAAGVGYLAAVRAAITAAGLSAATVLLDSTAAAKVLPAAKVWPLLPADDAQGAGSFTWLNVVNDLLAAIGYRGLWCDELGRYRSGPYVSSSGRPPEWSFTADTAATVNTPNRVRGVLLGANRELARDDWALPNRWTFYQRNPATGSAPLTYTRDDLAGQARRGLVWPAQPRALDAADAASLKVQGDAIADGDLRVAGLVKHTTSPFLLAGHADVYALVDTDLGLSGRVAAQGWVQSWSPGGVVADTEHDWLVI